MYLSGVVAPHMPRHPRLGFLYTPEKGNRIVPQTWFGFDTGVFGNPTAYSDDRYLAWLAQRERHRLRCLFATAPDVVRHVDGRVVGDWPATLERSLPVLPRIRDLGYRPAIVLQDGLTDAAEIPWSLVDAVFVGGSDDFKLRVAWPFVAEARARGKWAHLGRCNSWRRLRAAASGGYDSADGNFARWVNTNWPRMLGWLDALNRQPVLDEDAAA